MQLIDEGVRPGEGSPEARAEMEKLLGEMGINLDDYPDDYADNYDATKQMMQQAPAQPQPSQARQESPAATGVEVRRIQTWCFFARSMHRTLISLLEGVRLFNCCGGKLSKAPRCCQQ